MMAIENLWGEFLQVNKTRTPYHILWEQAKLLGNMTKNELTGEIERHTKRSNLLDEGFILEFLIFAPVLDYTYSVLSVRHGITMYPLRISSSTGKSDKCENEEEFLKSLKEVLSSEHLKKVIAGLLTQIQGDGVSTKSLPTDNKGITINEL
ncbi:hypothetical protein [Candidatus Parabeggiatoa sp. HSG14]|uniref:hypothetical protein n=1 Tax=Candidatus Parabeggiatoa sp. HSG14 TaxID=3055593 RepID=UPI0025A7F864|nr:hypothetical protein [Thiotrichales bacterium HSG14]